MKVRIISLFVCFTTLCAIELQAVNPFAPQAPAVTTAPMPSVVPASPKTNNPFAPQVPVMASTPVSTETKSSNPFVPTPAEPTSVTEPANPFSLSKSPEAVTTTPMLSVPASTETKKNPFAAHATEPEKHEEQKSIPTPVMDSGHTSTVVSTVSIKTITVTSGHAASLEPIVIDHGVAAEQYVVQDKKYESYLSHAVKKDQHGNEVAMLYSITVPGTVHEDGAFTVFKAKGGQTIPDHLEPAYHIEVLGNVHVAGEGMQYAELETPALEQLTQLEEKYAATIQTEFKAFTHEVRELISIAHKNGESLEAAKLHSVQKMMTKPPLTLHVAESHVATSFVGGSAQSSNPAIVSTALKFIGKKSEPKWDVILTAHKKGEALITYSMGSESYIQQVIVQEGMSSKKPVIAPDHTMDEEKESKPMMMKSHKDKSEVHNQEEKNNDHTDTVMMPKDIKEETASDKEELSPEKSSDKSMQEKVMHEILTAPQEESETIPFDSSADLQEKNEHDQEPEEISSEESETEDKVTEEEPVEPEQGQ